MGELPLTSNGKPITGPKSMLVGIIIWLFFSGLALCYVKRVGLGLLIFILNMVLVWTVIVPIIGWIVSLVLLVKYTNEINELWAKHISN